MGYYRIQETGHPIENHNSRYWGENPNGDELPGLCGCSDEDDLLRLIDTWDMEPMLDDFEVIEFGGTPVKDVGDGWVVTDVIELDRTPAAEWFKLNS